MSALGGGERKLTTVIADPAPRLPWIAWAPDGRSLGVLDRAPGRNALAVFRVRPDTGEKQQLTWPPADVAHGDLLFCFSPDGKRLAFARYKISHTGEIYVVGLNPPSSAKQLTNQNQNIAGLAWSTEPEAIIFSGEEAGPAAHSLWSISPEGGSAQRIDAAAAPAKRPAISSTGALIYEYEVRNANLWVQEISTPNRPRKVVASTRIDTSPQFSPDGSRIAFASNQSGALEIWACQSDGTAQVQLTNLGGQSHSPRWSPDGKQLVFSGLVEGNRDIYVMNADGASLRRLTSEQVEQGRPSFSRDGRFVYYYESRPESHEVRKIPTAGGQSQQVTDRGGHEAFESPDGLTLYYTKGPSHPEQPGVFAKPVTGGAETLLIPNIRSGFWTVAANGIYFIDVHAAGERPPLAVRFFDARSKSIRQVGVLEQPVQLSWPSMSATWDGRHIVWSQVDNTGIDLMLLSQFR